MLIADEAWQRAEVAKGFRREPNPGQPVTEPTEVRVAYRNSTLYQTQTIRTGADLFELTLRSEDQVILFGDDTLDRVTAFAYLFEL